MSRPHLHVLARLQSRLAQRVFQRHQGDAARAPAEDGLSAQRFKREVFLLFAPQDERTVALRQLADHSGGVFASLVGDIDGAFRPHQGDIGLPGQQRGHRLIRAARIGQLDLKPFVSKKAPLHCDILRRIEHRMRDLGKAHLFQPAALAPGQQQRRRQHKTHRCTDSLFHSRIFLLLKASLHPMRAFSPAFRFFANISGTNCEFC